MTKSPIPVSAIAAGFIAVLVGYTGSAVIVFQAAQAAGATPEQLSSWMTVLGIGMGLTCIGLSLRYKAPIVTAWSTPGAALLVTSLSGVPMNEAIGAFLFCGLLMMLCGVTGWFERIMDNLPLPIAAAMLAGVLFQFGVDVFRAMQNEVWLVLAMFIIYLIGKRFWTRYAVIGVLALGALLAWQMGLMKFEAISLDIARPIFVMPAFSVNTLISVGIPLFVVTMASQNVPGATVLRASGYDTPLSPLISWTGFTTVVMSPFGGFAYNLAAITAAICMGKEAHSDPDKRYLAAVSAGVFYLIIGIFGAAVATFFAAFPQALVLALAGLALLSTIASGLTTAMSNDDLRESAIITFLVTASGIKLWDIGAAFWGLIAGVLAMLVLAKIRNS